MSSLRHTLARAAAMVLGVVILTGVAAGTAHADESGRTTPSAAITSLTPGIPVAIQGNGLYTNAVTDGWFAGLVYLDPNLPWRPSTNLWVPGSEVYLGPGGMTYQQIRFKGGQCLSHQPVYSATEGMLMIEPCVLSNNSQWWAVDHRWLYTPPCPTPPFCSPSVFADLLVPWDASERAATVQDGLLLLRPRSGPTGSPAQRLTITSIPKFE